MATHRVEDIYQIFVQLQTLLSDDPAFVNPIPAIFADQYAVDVESAELPALNQVKNLPKV